MKKVLTFSLVIILTFVFYQQFLLNDARAGDEGAILNVNEIIKNVDPDKFTKAQIKEYHKNVVKKNAKGEGIVVDVLPGKKNRHRVTILTSASNPEKGYNVVLYTTQDSPPDLGKNEKIAFEGEIGRVSTFRGASVDIHGTYIKVSKK